MWTRYWPRHRNAGIAVHDAIAGCDQDVLSSNGGNTARIEVDPVSLAHRPSC
jgi:hypothetical protein